MERGYHAFSYQDISTVLGIRNAAVHYHFRTKAGLVEAVLQRYRARFLSWAAQLGGQSAEAQLAAYVAVVRGFVEQGRICPMAMLSTEHPTLPEALKEPVAGLLAEICGWLASVLQQGVEEGSLRLSGPCEGVAAQVVATLSGAQQLGRVRGVEAFDQVVAQLLAGLRAG